MNKIALAKEIASRMSTTVTQTLCFIDTMNDVICESISHDKSVIIQNFGHYMPWQQTERLGRNPRSGKECTIPSRVSVKFKPGKGLIEKINEK